MAPTPDEGDDSLWRVLESIRVGRAESRSGLAAVTGLGRGPVAHRLGQLIAAGIVEEGGIGVSTGGRPPRQITFTAAVGSILVADIGATSIDVGLADLSGRLLDHLSVPADVTAGPDVVLTKVEELFDQLAARAEDMPPLFGVGLGVPGPVEFATGRPVAPPIMPGWDGYGIRERFETRYDAPVWVDNDVNVMALGEWRAGVARGHANVVWVKIGTGIGAGLISDGQLHRGAKGAAGDVGHIQVVDESIVCRCGQVGCLEAVAGGAALERDALAAARAGASAFLGDALSRDGHVAGPVIARGGQHGDPVCVSLLRRSGQYVGSMLASVVNFFNPSLIVVGGGVASSGDLLLASLRETIYGRSLPLATRDLMVVNSSLGALAGVVGAAAMVADELFSRPRLQDTLKRASEAGGGRRAGPDEGAADVSTAFPGRDTARSSGAASVPRPAGWTT